MGYPLVIGRHTISLLGLIIVEGSSSVKFLQDYSLSIGE